MHNFIKSDISIANSLNAVGSRLKDPKKAFFADSKETLEKLFIDYNEKAANNRLHLLRPVWAVQSSDNTATKNEKINNRQLAYGLYGSTRRFVNEHWERLKAINGGKTLYCPICGLHECEEMDHFVPRDDDQFPEYSAHLDNLIPLCHNCNHKKSNMFLGNSDERLFFNAYYDILTDRNILVGVISLSPVNGLPQINVSVNPRLLKTSVPDKYILSTIKVLSLMDRFNDRAKYCLKQEMTRLSYRVGQPWQIIRDEMNKLAIPIDGDHDIVRPAVMGAIANSTVMEEWYNTLKPI